MDEIGEEETEEEDETEEEEEVISRDERNRWKRKRIMLHNQAVYFPAWNGEHKRRCLDAAVGRASSGGAVSVSCLQLNL